MSQHSKNDASPAVPWLMAFGWYGLILLTIPYARQIEEGAAAIFGRGGIYLAAVPFGLLLFFTLFHAIKRDPRSLARRACWFAVLSAATVWLFATQLQRPIEYMHFMQYSVLSALLVVSWERSKPGAMLYWLVLLSIALAAFFDEFLQWVVPGRYWDVRDVRLNVIAGGIMLFFMNEVVRVSGPGRRASRALVRTACRMGWAFLLCMAFAYWNTPARVADYAARIPGIQFLTDNPSVMVEYGYKHEAPGIGTFYSRLTLDALAGTDQAHGRDAGTVIAASMGTIKYMDFLKQHPSHREPFLHEMRVHLYRRNHYYRAGWKHREKDPGRYVHHMTVAFRENQILETYFSNALAAADQHLKENELAEIVRSADMERAYISPVSSHLVTGWRMAECQVLFLVLAGGIGMIYVQYGRERHERTET